MWVSMNASAYFSPLYRTPSMEFWGDLGKARVDSVTDPRTHRLHNLIRPAFILDRSGNGELTVDGVTPVAAGSQAYLLLGYDCYEGVRRNRGRVGQGTPGPLAVREALRNLPDQFPEIDLYDGGDIVFTTLSGDEPLLTTQMTFSRAVQLVYSQGIMPIGIGGGNDLSFGHGHGVYSRFAKRPGIRVGVINWDQHLDLRPVEERGITSGTPFRQLAGLCEEMGLPFQYMCLGVKRTSNTTLLFDYAQTIGAVMVFAEEMMERNLDDIEKRIDEFLAGADVVYLTFDLDVFISGSAPGVSAINPDGVTPGPLFYYLFDRIIQSGKVVSVDVTELAASGLDAPNGCTAQLTARLIHHFVDQRALLSQSNDILRVA